MLKLFGAAGAALAAAALLAGPAAAATAIYDNLGAVTNGVDALSQLTNPGYGDGPESSSFSTGAGGFVPSDVQLLLVGEYPADGDHFTVSLLADDNTSPGAVIASTGLVSDSVMTNQLSVVDFKLSASLAASTRYWVQLSTSDGSSALWAFAMDTSGLGVAGEYYDCAICGVTANDEPYQMAISGDAPATGAVPEPATWAMLLIGLFGLGAVLRVRRTDEPAAVAA